MYMKKSLLFILLLVFPVLAMAQASGGQIRRQKRNLPNSVVNRHTPPAKPITEEKQKRQKEVDRILSAIEGNMVYVDGGSFMMGATPEQEKDAFTNEKPMHKVTLNSFYICKYEVTQEEWNTIFGWHSSNAEEGKLPATCSWGECSIFIQKLNDLTGKNYRLPTEAEWEYAARGGRKSRGYKYAGSNSISDVAWFYSNSNNKPHVVGEKMPNELGLYDMCGNVWEWCQDRYTVYTKEDQTNPINSQGGENIQRGGSWDNDALLCRLSYRYFNAQRECSGLRLAY